ncbi:MAG: tetratricopeptide repeat protein [Planctomycetes bacterium]|nr:tetratricopeptide repeat protein [Planctomycetota bacterium]
MMRTPARKYCGLWGAHGPTQQAVSRPLAVFAGLGAAIFVGCQASQPTPRAEAQRAWDGQRAALKYELAEAELQHGRTGQAITLAREAVGLSPVQPGHAQLLARAYLAQGDPAAAYNVLTSLRRTHPQFAEAAYLLGVVHERQQRWDRAIAEFSAAVRIRPDVLDYRIALAQALTAAGNTAAATATLAEAEDRFEAEPLYQLACAELYRQAGLLEPACLAYERALQLGINDAAAQQALGLCQYWLGNHEAAQDYLEPIVLREKSPSLAVMSAYAGCLFAQGHLQPAADWLTRFTAQCPDGGPLWLLLARVQHAQGDLAAAADSARQATRLMPQAPEAFLVLAAICLDNEQLAEAERAVQRVLARTPRDIEALLLAGRICQRRGTNEQAGAAYRSVLALDPGHQLASELLAQVERRTEQD